MKAYRLIATLFFLIVLASSDAAAQLAQPVISAGDVGWGWFDLTMTGASVTPANTHWEITSDGVPVLDTWRRRGPECEGPFYEMRVPNEFVADTRDLTSKRIIGSAPDRTYIARVRYNDGAQWSPFSEPISITTPPEPVRTDDTVHVVVWGHSLAGFGTECGVNTSIINGDGGDGFTVLYDNPSFTHALQTQLRRTTGRTVTIINGAISGSRQSRWMRSGIGNDTAVDHVGEEYQNNIRHYQPGGMFADAQRYPIAVFFFGQNDARSGWCEQATYPAWRFAADATSIIDRLTSQGVQVVYNSIHYATPYDCGPTGYWGGAPADWQLEYLDVWDSLMTALVPRNNRLVRGFDLHALFRSDTARFHFLDGAHANTSEATPQIVEAIAPSIVSAITRVSGVRDDRQADALASLRIVRTSMGYEARVELRADESRQTTVEAYNAVGEKVATVVNRAIEPGVHSFAFGDALVAGPYLLVMRAGATVAAERFDVVR